MSFSKMVMEFVSLGVFGLSEEEFFQRLVSEKIDLFCDLRHWRAVRGKQYVFVNHKRLVQKLNALGINYLHAEGLATPKAIRDIQFQADKKAHQSIRERTQLSPSFCSAYQKEIIDVFDFPGFIEELKQLGAKRIALFCVEAPAKACHRYLVAQHLSTLGYKVTHL